MTTVTTPSGPFTKNQRVYFWWDEGADQGHRQCLGTVVRVNRLSYTIQWDNREETQIVYKDLAHARISPVDWDEQEGTVPVKARDASAAPEVWTFEERQRVRERERDNKNRHQSVNEEALRAVSTVNDLVKAFEHVYDCTRREDGRTCKQCAAAYKLYKAVKGGA